MRLSLMYSLLYNKYLIGGVVIWGWDCLLRGLRDNQSAPRSTLLTSTRF